MESSLVLLLALAMVPFQLGSGEQGCGEGRGFREMSEHKRKSFGGALKAQGFERLARGSGALVAL